MTATDPTQALLDADGLDRLRTALHGYTADSVHDLLGPSGESALARGDLAGVRRAVRPHDDRVADLVRLFLLGDAVDERAARAALAPLPLGAAVTGALLEPAGAGSVRALVDLRPYAENDGTDAWWVVSDPGSDVRPGPLAPDHVLGVGAAATTLAQTVPRDPAGRGLDVGTGCGVQALHLARHSHTVTATDLSARALRFAATTAALSGQSWDLRRGSLLAPVADERFDLIVSNPPFVVSAGGAGFDYRDGGRPGDALCAELVGALPDRLAPGGSAHLLANWVITADEPWDARVSQWVGGRGCDAWFWQREVAEPGEYATLWLRDAGETPGTARWAQRYDAWLDWFTAAGVLAVGMGMVHMWRTDADDPVLVCDEVPQPMAQPVGPAVADWYRRQTWLRHRPSVGDLAAGALVCSPGVGRENRSVPGPDGWTPASAHLVQADGLRWEVEVDDAVSAFVAGCDGTRTVGELAAVLALVHGVAAVDVLAALDPVLRDLLARGLLSPADETTGGWLG